MKTAVPSTKVGPIKEDRLTEAVKNIIMYALLAQETMRIIQREQRQARNQFMRLQIEASFCENLLENIFRVPLSIVEQISQALRMDASFAKRVEEFSNAVAPQKSILVPAGPQPLPGRKIIIP